MPIDGHAQPPRTNRRRRVHARKEGIVHDAVAKIITAVDGPGRGGISRRRGYSAN